MEQGYLITECQPVEGYSKFNGERVISYRMFETDKSYGIKISYADGRYSIFEKMKLNPDSTSKAIKDSLKR